MAKYTHWEQLLEARNEKLNLNYRVCTDNYAWHNPSTKFLSFENALFGNPDGENYSAKELFRKGSKLQIDRESKYGKAHFVVIWSDMFSWALIIERSKNIVTYVSASEIDILESEHRSKESSPPDYKYKLKLLCERITEPKSFLFDKDFFTNELPVEIKSTAKKIETEENDDELHQINIELEQLVKSSLSSKKQRRKRLEKASKKAIRKKVTTYVFIRNPDVIAETLDRANGVCEKCESKAPFIRAKDSTPYLEVHHEKMLSEGGDDHPTNTIALCPNCHRKMHYG